MARGSVNLFEQHVEKIALGLGALFLAAMAYMYLVRSPNRVEVDGQQLPPAALSEAIQRDTEALQRAVKTAVAGDTEVPDYSGQLAEQHAAGLFAAKPGREPLVPAELPLAADFGQPIPNLREDQEEGQSDISLVPPLAPSVPVARTGRNLVLRERPTLTHPSEKPTDAGAEAPQAELPWVSVAAYFDRTAQQNAMTKAGYATYLSKIYLAGVDVQRQELLADGRFSDWQDVTRSMAMPQVDIPIPESDSATGAVVNRDALNQAFATVKANQRQICQPAFYRIEAGEDWRMPALEGYPDPDSSGKKPKTTKSTKDSKEKAGETKESDAKESKVEPGAEKVERDRADTDLKRAEEAYRKGQDDDALRAAKEVVDNPYSKGIARNKAKAILRSVELLKKQTTKKEAAARSTITVEPPKPDQAGTKTTPAGTEVAKELPLVAHPKDPEKLAVWFHDDSVQSGKSYRYRMRVKLWNRYVTKFAALRDPAQARQTVLLGDWSLPSEPITVSPAAYFFLTSATPGKDTATVTVFKWHKGARIKQSFNVGIGDLIGGVLESETGILDRQTLDSTRETIDFSTGALVLDLRFEQPVVQRTISDKGKGEFTLRDVDSAVLVYLDPADGQVKQRVERLDKNDPLLRALRDEE